MNENDSRLTIKELIESDRPRERMATFGAESLQTAELLAILLRVGMKGETAVDIGGRLLVRFGGLQGIQRATLAELSKERGLGLAKASQIKAAIELGRRLAQEVPAEKPLLSNPEAIYSLVGYEMAGYEVENLWVLLADMKNRLINIQKIYTGTLNASMVRVSELFRPAIEQNAASIVIVHNHPSGDPTPSTEDINLTRAVVQAGTLLDIPLLDHVIVGGHQRYISMRQKKLGFN
ncbi:MAG TPA: DNA repair protein RadC [Bellilinea sp.]|nr:DNA repair protein RadC [Bellilinea sp.]